MAEDGDLLDPVAIERLKNLELAARTIVAGALAGMHRSPHHGAAVEFAEHKEYSPGDDLKHVDWKAFGKLDKYYVKRFEEETEWKAYLLVDASASMGYASDGGVSKLAYAKQLAAALGYLLLRQQDHVGLVTFADEVRDYLPARARVGQLADLLSTLGELAPSGTTNLARALGYVSEVAHRRSLIVLFSDLLEEGAGEAAAAEAAHLLRGLRARRHDVVVFHLLDRDELTLPFSGTSWFTSMEGRGRLLAEPEEVRRAYLAELQRFIDGYRRGLAEGDVEYHLVDTRLPPSEVLLSLVNNVTRRGRLRAGGR